MPYALESDEILTVPDIARELRCSKSHVYNVMCGEATGVTPLTAITTGTRKLVRCSSFEEWKRENEATTVWTYRSGNDAVGR